MNVDVIPTKKAILGVPVGGIVSVPVREAKILVTLGRARYPANGYQTRSMEATDLPPADLEVVEPAVPDEKPKRKYTRRVKPEE